MCGIAGFAGPMAAHRGKGVVCRMLRELERRGPDDSGTAVWDDAVLGSRRLAILDTSTAGAQPMLSPDRSVGVVFNGAIYNFLELCQVLTKAGFRFRTNCDTEVLVHGYRHWGIDRLLARLDGMFAFGIWDQSRRKLFLARDRLGVKPLVYTVTGDWLAFGSTARALSRAGLVRELSAQGIAGYLDVGYITDRRCIYSEAQKLAAGSILEWSEGRLTARSYLSDDSAESSIRFADAVVESERLLLAAVERRLNSDVPMGALLSGGVDSALICWAAKRLGSDLPAYTLNVPGEADESRLAREAAETIGLDHRVVSLAPAGSDVGELVDAFAEPFASSSALGMLRLSRALREHITVVLTGDGGDEAFLGYPSHLYYWMTQRAAERLPGWSTPLWKVVRPFVPNFSIAGRGKHFVDYATGGLAAAMESHTRLPYYLRHDLLGSRLARSLPMDGSAPAWSIQSARSLLGDFQAHHLSTRLVGEFLTKIDGSTSHYGMEARSPFLDRQLWKFAHSIPFGTRLHGGQPKAILRELARRNVGPRVAVRSKRGFTVPVQELLTTTLRGAFVEAFQESHGPADGWIHGRAVLREFERRPVEQGGWENLWRLFVLQLWLHNERDSREEATEEYAVA